MWLCVLFLLSSVFLARLFEKRKMKIASLAYSVLFTFMLFTFIFVFELPFFKVALINLFGELLYAEIASILLSESELITFLGFLLAVQVAIAILTTSTAIVNKLKKRDPLSIKEKNCFFKAIREYNVLSSTEINRLYCRMLD